jgi:hypothetical protein
MKTGVSYFGNRILEHYRDRDLPDIVAAGCSYVVHTFSEADLRFYAGTMKEMIMATHQAGLEVYLDPWGVGGLFAGEAFSDFLVRYPDAWQVRADGAKVAAACPNTPQFQAFMGKWLDSALQLSPDVVFWDDPHWHIPPGPIGAGQDWTCRCVPCQERFHRRYGRAMPGSMTAEVAEFREDSLVELVRSGSALLQSRGVKSAVGLLPFEDPEHSFVHWEKLAAIPGVDILAVSPFWQVFGQAPALPGQARDQFVARWCQRLVQVCQAHRKEPMVWLQAFLVEAGQEAELAMAAETAYEAGVRSLAAWGFRGCAHMSSLRCQRPEVMWDVVGQTFRELRLRG